MASTATVGVGSGSDRLVSLDALRGLAMLLMASEGLGMPQVAAQFPDNKVWQSVSYHFSHAAWWGGGLWDMIQPTFMFLVGTSMAFSYTRRRDRGQSYRGMLGHAIWRALVLTALGILLRSRWTFEDVLTQIGLGYVFLFLLWDRGWRIPALVAALVLIGDWALFALWPSPGAEVDLASVGVTTDWLAAHGFDGFAAHWTKNANPAHAFDVWWLNLFPRSEPFLYNGGGYQTLNFLPSLATMIFGLLAGEWLRVSRSSRVRVIVLIGWGVLALIASWALDVSGICPIVKRIWTPSWTLYSTGVVLITLALVYGIVDGIGLKFWTWPLVVVGANSITMYLMAYLISGWIEETLEGLGGPEIFEVFDRTVTMSDGSTEVVTFAPIVEHTSVLLVLWLICWRLYANRIFLRI